MKISSTVHIVFSSYWSRAPLSDVETKLWELYRCSKFAYHGYVLDTSSLAARYILRYDFHNAFMRKFANIQCTLHQFAHSLAPHYIECDEIDHTSTEARNC
jgi:hypothetical protein